MFYLGFNVDRSMFYLGFNVDRFMFYLGFNVDRLRCTLIPYYGEFSDGLI